MKAANLYSRSLSPAILLLVFAVLDFPYQYGFRYLTFSESISFTVIDALLYTAILFISTRLDLARVTLCFLALPYLIFIPGWLNLPTAIVLMAIFIFCMARTLQATHIPSFQYITVRDLATFIVILVWVNVSGIGGYGFQWPDYEINNARLHDLVVNAWPIRYGENQNFVYYFGYFLPSAIIGKLSTVDLAMRSVYFWALLGVTLSLRWLSLLSKWPYSITLAIIFIVFGPFDILNLLYIKSLSTSHFLADVFSTFKYDDMDTLTFTTSQELKFYSLSQQKLFFLGNYPGNSFQLYWSPQQLIAGWLCAALMMHLFLENKTRHILFVYALLFLWGVLVMIALLPFILVTVALQFFNTSLPDKNKSGLLSFENTVGAGALACVFVIFYLGGSTSANPVFWLVSVVDWHSQWDLIVIFYLAAWGIYALALAPYILSCERNTRIWFSCLVLALAILPLRIFGEWSDLLCRGSAALMFLLLVFLLKAIRHYWHDQQPIRAVILLLLLVPGTTCALLINSISLRPMYYGQTQAVKTLLDYKSIYPNFGPDNSLFNQLFRRNLPGQKSEQALHE